MLKRVLLAAVMVVASGQAGEAAGEAAQAAATPMSDAELTKELLKTITAAQPDLLKHCPDTSVRCLVPASSSELPADLPALREMWVCFMQTQPPADTPMCNELLTHLIGPPQSPEQQEAAKAAAEAAKVEVAAAKAEAAAKVEAVKAEAASPAGKVAAEDKKKDARATVERLCPSQAAACAASSEVKAFVACIKTQPMPAAADAATSQACLDMLGLLGKSRAEMAAILKQREEDGKQEL